MRNRNRSNVQLNPIIGFPLTVIVIVCGLIKAFWPVLIIVVLLAIFLPVLMEYMADAPRREQNEEILSKPLPPQPDAKCFTVTREKPYVDGFAFCAELNQSWSQISKLEWLENAVCQLQEKCQLLTGFLQKDERHQIEQQIEAFNNEYEQIKNTLSTKPINDCCLTSNSIGFERLKQAMLKSTDQCKIHVFFERFGALCYDSTKDPKTMWVFFPSVIAIINSKDSSIRFYDYEEITAVTFINEEIAHDSVAIDDEFAGIRWLHTRNDGGPDMRYSNNPSYRTVYRGRMYVHYGIEGVSLSFSNKSKTEEAYKAYESHQRQIEVINQKQEKTKSLEHLDNTSCSNTARVSVGDVVINAVYGEGVVQSVQPNGYLKILFEKGVKDYKSPECFTKGYLKKKQ